MNIDTNKKNNNRTESQAQSQQQQQQQQQHWIVYCTLSLIIFTNQKKI